MEPVMCERLWNEIGYEYRGCLYNVMSSMAGSWACQGTARRFDSHDIASWLRLHLRPMVRGKDECSEVMSKVLGEDMAFDAVIKRAESRSGAGASANEVMDAISDELDDMTLFVEWLFPFHQVNNPVHFTQLKEYAGEFPFPEVGCGFAKMLKWAESTSKESSLPSIVTAKLAGVDVDDIFGSAS